MCPLGWSANGNMLTPWCQTSVPSFAPRRAQGLPFNASRTFEQYCTHHLLHAYGGTALLLLPLELVLLLLLLPPRLLLRMTSPPSSLMPSGGILMGPWPGSCTKCARNSAVSARTTHTCGVSKNNTHTHIHNSSMQSTASAGSTAKSKAEECQLNSASHCWWHCFECLTSATIILWKHPSHLRMRRRCSMLQALQDDVCFRSPN